MPKKYIDEKKWAIELRKAGYSYNEISKQLRIAKSTLGVWFNEYAELNTIKEVNIQKNREDSKVQFFKYLDSRKKLLFIKYEDVEKEAIVSYEPHKHEQLFTSGLVLYASEGDRRSRAHIRVSNTDWRLHALFIRFCCTYLGYSRERICLEIIAYNDLLQEEIEAFWKHKLQLNKLYKTQFITGKSKRKLQFGVAMTIINDTRAKVVLLKWLELYLNEQAAII